MIADPPSLRERDHLLRAGGGARLDLRAAWAQLARAHADLLLQRARRTRRAPTRRGAPPSAPRPLAPDRPETHLALGDYYALDRGDNASGARGVRGGPQERAGQRRPATRPALAEQSLGRWDSRRAAPGAGLDARPPLGDHRAAPRRKACSACGAIPRRRPPPTAGLAVAPDNLDLIENKAMVHLAQGDLAGARAAIRAAPAEVEPTDARGLLRQLLGSLLGARRRPAAAAAAPAAGAFDDDRGTWGIVRASTYYLRGDRARARVYADSARLAFEEHVRRRRRTTPSATSSSGSPWPTWGGRRRRSRKASEAWRCCRLSRDGYLGPYIQHQLARIYIWSGEPEKALDQLEPLLKMPYYLSPGWLRIDPTFDPLRDNPRFQRLVAGAP